MKIAIVVAMQKELDLLLPHISDAITSVKGRFTIHRGQMAGCEVIAMQSGIGKVNSALALQCLLDDFAPDLVINTGVAGGTGSAGILDVVVGNRVAYHDVWCGPGTVPGQASDCPQYFEPPCGLLDLPALGSDSGVIHGLIASGDIFVSSPEETERIRGLYPDVAAVDMESASMAQTCWLNGVPFVSVRVVSDTPGAADNISQYENFWTDAPMRTFSVLMPLVEQISQQWKK
ncbi:MAG: 5'-methylthioadenosine/S-adenosylhomocysteine nucleosidase [Paramuribaculum sp.]|nr:5'-methylthioadenosine/S-adenosylhomocysteine nucleosidase [Paramuribaculum sp.]MDE5722790.1 5'-methylthioadenosine/S-adenosylhomocysteine nucleosidase [Paramuribaculum sp.]